MKKFLGLILILLIVIFVGCGNGIEKKAMDQAKLALANKEYDKASVSLQLALDENSQNDEARKIKEIIDTYLEAKKLFDGNNIDYANEKILSIDKLYSNYPIKDDIDSLKTDIENKIALRDKVKNDIDKSDKLITEKKYDEAQSILNGLDKSVLDDIQKNKVNGLSSIIAKESAKIKPADDAKQAQVDKALTPEKAKQLILKEDEKFISKAINDSTKFTPDYKEYSAEDMPTGDAWNLPKEPCYEFSICTYDNNGEIASGYCEYLVGKNSKNVYVMSNQGNTSVYQIENNQKVKTFKWIKEGESFDWR